MTSSGLPMLISSSTDFDEIDHILENVPTLSYEMQNSYDLIQQSIISGNESALSYLLMKPYQNASHHPPCNDYLHLACKLGYQNMIKKILEARPQDFYRMGRVCYPNSCFHAPNTYKSMAPLELGQLPLDIIVTTKDIECLLALLRYIPSPNANNFSPAGLLCDLNHPSALQLYLKSPVPQNEIKEAFRWSLLKKRHACLDVLLSNGFSDMFIEGMNPFHFLYQYSSGYNRHAVRHDGIAATTQVLLKYGADVAAQYPVGSYPLYTLVTFILGDAEDYGEEYVSESIPGHELLACLKILVKQDIRLDLDEVQISIDKKTDTLAFGRSLCRSVFDALSIRASLCTDFNLPASEVLLSCVTVLLDCRKRHNLKTHDLSGVLKLMGRTQRSNSIQKNLQRVVYKYLWHGINPSRPATSHPSPLYLINQYIEAMIFSNFLPELHLSHTLNGNPAVRWIINSMEHTAAKAATRINATIFEASVGHEKLFTPSMLKFITQPPLLRLKTLAAKVVWYAVGRQRVDLALLPIPGHLKNEFLDIIIKDI